jgi:thiol-disulfide isomerase/thioredoxin
MKMKLLFSTLLLALLASGVYSLTSPKQVQTEEIDVIAVYMYADWCSACQNIKPKMAKAEREFENEPILFTKMDMTDDFTAHQSKLLASRIGVLDIFEKNEGKTGFVLLVDANTNEILDRITTDDDKDGIVKKINDTFRNH